MSLRKAEAADLGFEYTRQVAASTTAVRFVLNLDDRKCLRLIFTGRETKAMVHVRLGNRNGTTYRTVIVLNFERIGPK